MREWSTYALASRCVKTGELDRAEELARQAGSPWLRMAVSKKDKELLAHMKAVNFQYRGNLEYQGARRVAYELRLK